MKNTFLSLILFACILSCGTENKRIYTYAGTAAPLNGGTIDPDFGQFSEGTSVDITAIPSEGWEFVRWEGALTHAENPTHIRMNKEQRVVAVFRRMIFELDITIEGEGTVEKRIVSTPQKSVHPFETVIELTAKPPAPSLWYFSGWSGDLSGTENPITFEITSAKNITATFIEYVLKEDDVYNPVTGRVWKDRNLGASRVATSVNDVEASGGLYQWGRATDGHEIRTSPTTSTLSSSDQPNHGSFIVAPQFPFDWRDPQNEELWQGLNGINNPCPADFRIPTQSEWIDERSSWSSETGTAAFESPLKLPNTGRRRDFDSSLGNTTTHGFYWSSTIVVPGNGPIFHVISEGASVMNERNRAFGHAVRCIKD